MRANAAGEGGVAVALDVADPVVVGLSVLATIRVTNAGTSPATVSTRLNLAEGDVQLTVVGPDGATREIKGWQADTALRRATLRPGEHLASGINLLHTDAGPTFPEPGKYVLRAQYWPSPKADPVASPPVSMTARLPRPGPETDAAAVLADRGLREAVVLAKPDDAPDGLRQLAAVPGALLDTELARMLTSQETADEVPDPVRRAVAITALSGPYSKVGKKLAADFASRLARDAARRESAAASDAVAAALRIVKGEPLGPP